MTQAMAPQERIIFALDVPDKQEAVKLLEQLEGVISFYKVGWELFLSEGLGFIRELKNRGHRVFLDLKIQDDVDETVRRYIQVAVREQVDFVTLHGSEKLFGTARKAKGGAPLQLLSLTLLSNMDEEAMKDIALLDNGTGFSLPFKKPEDYVQWKATRTFDAGADGFIASGRFVKFVRGLFQASHPLIVTPGVRPSGSAHAEHKNVLTPTEAIMNGSDFLVVGRPIRDAQSPHAVAQAIVQEIAEALESKSLIS
ncbi:MAG: orotidine-5'-phosphate decarboxylase [Nitrospirales bacterium]